MTTKVTTPRDVAHGIVCARQDSEWCHWTTDRTVHAHYCDTLATAFERRDDSIREEERAKWRDAYETSDRSVAVATMRAEAAERDAEGKTLSLADAEKELVAAESRIADLERERDEAREHMYRWCRCPDCIIDRTARARDALSRPPQEPATAKRTCSCPPNDCEAHAMVDPSVVCRVAAPQEPVKRCADWCGGPTGQRPPLHGEVQDAFASPASATHRPTPGE